MDLGHPKKYYVYTLSVSPGGVFYVGKGTGKRYAAHEQEAKRGCDCAKCLVILDSLNRGVPYQVKFMFWTDDEDSALKREKDLIAWHQKRKGDKLCNVSRSGLRREYRVSQSHSACDGWERAVAACIDGTLTYRQRKKYGAALISAKILSEEN